MNRQCGSMHSAPERGCQSGQARQYEAHRYEYRTLKLLRVLLTLPALHVAAYIGNEACIGVLLKGKASKTIVDASNQTALYPACEQGHVAAAKAMIVGGLSVNPSPDIEVTAIYLESSKFQNRMPLHWAAISGRADIITLLTDNKAQIDVFDQRGESVSVFQHCSHQAF